MNTRIGKRKYIRQRARQAKKGFNPKFYASCYNKTRFDKKQAKEVAKKLDITFYRCKFCSDRKVIYHIGRKER